MTQTMTRSGKIMTGVLLLAVATASLGYATSAEARKGPGHGGPRIAFEAVDTNGDGQITEAELEAHHKARFAKMDTDGDGALSVEEVAEAAKQGMAKRAQKRAERMVKRHDANGDGKIGQDESKPRNGGRMIDYMDTDGDGQVSKAEFDSATEGHRGHRKHRMKKSADE